MSYLERERVNAVLIKAGLNQKQKQNHRIQKEWVRFFFLFFFFLSWQPKLIWTNRISRTNNVRGFGEAMTHNHSTHGWITERTTGAQAQEVMELRGHHFQMLLKEKPNHYKETENYHKEIKDINRGTKKQMTKSQKITRMSHKQARIGYSVWLLGREGWCSIIIFIYYLFIVGHVQSWQWVGITCMLLPLSLGRLNWQLFFFFFSDTA